MPGKGKKSAVPTGAELQLQSDIDLIGATWLVVSVVILLISGCVCWDELIYLVSGQNVYAEITNTHKVYGGDYSENAKPRRLTLDFIYTEAGGTRRMGTDTVPADWPIPEGGFVPIRYIPGQDHSRIAGHINWISPVFLGLSVLSLALFGIRVWRKAAKATREKKRKMKLA
jgi:hypothetical protein